ncbi:MAG: hypothetical protein RI897_1876 [Verrucomicrobiota bacterium]
MEAAEVSGLWWSWASCGGVQEKGWWSKMIQLERSSLGS